MRNNLFGKGFVRTPFKKTPLVVSYGAQVFDTSVETLVDTNWSFDTAEVTNYSSNWNTSHETYKTSEYTITTGNTTFFDTYYDTEYQRTTDAFTDYPYYVEVSVPFTSYWNTDYTATTTRETYDADSFTGTFTQSKDASGNFLPEGTMTMNAINVHGATFGPWYGGWDITYDLGNGAGGGTWAVAYSSITISGTWTVDTNSIVRFTGTANEPTWRATYSGTGYGSGNNAGVLNAGSIYVYLPYEDTYTYKVTTDFDTFRDSLQQETTSIKTYYESFWDFTTDRETNAPTSWDITLDTSYLGTTTYQTSQATSYITDWTQTTSQQTIKTSVFETTFTTVNPFLAPTYGFNENLNILIIGDDLTANTVPSNDYFGAPNVYNMDANGNWRVAVSPSVTPLAVPMTTPLGNFHSVMGKYIRQKSSWFGSVNFMNVSVPGTRLEWWLKEPATNGYTPTSEDTFQYTNNKLFERILFAKQALGDEKIHAIIINLTKADKAAGVTEADYLAQLNQLNTDLVFSDIETFIIINTDSSSPTIDNAINSYVSASPDISLKGLDISTLASTSEINNGILTAAGADVVADSLSSTIISVFS